MLLELNRSIVITDYGSTRRDFEFFPKVETIKSLAGDPGHVHGYIIIIIIIIIISLWDMYRNYILSLSSK